MTDSLFDQIRAACRAVANDARFVRIDDERLPAYAASLAAGGLPEPAYDTAHHVRADPETTAAFVIALDAVNFGSGWFPLLRKRPGSSGYFTIATSLKERFEEIGAISAGDLAAIAAADCAAIFGQTDAPAPIQELMARFAASLRDLGRLVDDRYGGRFLTLVAAADGSAERLVRSLAALPSFQDVARYGGRDVPLYKRAQLTAADLHLAFAGLGPGRFVDLDRLTIFADNVVPHVLRVDGVLRYDAELAARIDREDPIAAGSPEEIELRACALDACERLVALLRPAAPEITAQRLDYLLWNRGRLPLYKARPRHRARSLFY
ncbi:MAG TPA: queuosine salvage family protein [Thermomicrobiales bacterium]|nr:queuosine salvage family protein [Thermomicrobiales bacterium]